MHQTRGVVWIRNGVYTTQCPKSLIGSKSLEWLDLFGAGNVIGGIDPLTLDAKTADALALLQQEVRKEINNGNE